MPAPGCNALHHLPAFIAQLLRPFLWLAWQAGGSGLVSFHFRLFPVIAVGGLIPHSQQRF